MKSALYDYFSKNFKDDMKPKMKKYKVLIMITVYREMIEILAKYGVNPKLKHGLDKNDLEESYLVNFLNNSGKVDDQTKNEVITHNFGDFESEEGKKLKSKMSVNNYRQGFQLNHRRTADKYSVLEFFANNLLNRLTVMRCQKRIESDQMGVYYPMPYTYTRDNSDKNVAQPATTPGDEKAIYTTMLNVHPDLNLKTSMEACFETIGSDGSGSSSSEDKRNAVERLKNVTRVLTIAEVNEVLVKEISNKGRPSKNKKRKAEEENDDSAKVAGEKEAETVAKSAKKAKTSRKKSAKKTGKESKESESVAAVTVVTGNKSANADASMEEEPGDEYESKVKQLLSSFGLGKDLIGRIVPELCSLSVNARKAEKRVLFDSSSEEEEHDDDDEDEDEGENASSNDNDSSENQEETAYDMIKRILKEKDFMLASFYPTGQLRYDVSNYQTKLSIAIIGKRNRSNGNHHRTLNTLALVTDNIEGDNKLMKEYLAQAKKIGDEYNAKVKMYTFKYQDKGESLKTDAPTTFGDDDAKIELHILRDISDARLNYFEYFLLEKRD